MKTPVENAVELIRESNHIVALTGAGISTEAGIPDFRSTGGLWENEALLELMSAEGFRRDPAQFYRASLQLLPNIHRAEPTRAHRFLARLEEAGKLQTIVTQNIDGLHQAAGSTIVHEIHGNFRTGHCVDCHTEYRMTEFYHLIETGEINLPACAGCLAPIKADVILFGDLLPIDDWSASVAAAEECDLMLVLGSSLVVYPAADLPRIAAARGARLIIINRDPGDFDSLADVVVLSELGEFAEKAAAILWPESA